ncbi:hypothetical protein [Microbacterium terrisoli]|uniref:hypothetical protein n=1 Tax=Microbacterium terrisoli TaxID=3242192 RepID=UPI002805C445|nr:hypothetical protein [Microbacterium protaetiae]
MSEAIEQAEAVLAAFDDPESRWQPNEADLALTVRDLLAEHKRVLAEMHQRELHHFETEQMLTEAGIDVDSSVEEKPACETFAWVGQPFTHCDDCGRPYWEHTYEWGLGANAGKRIKITDAARVRARARWEQS